MRSVLEGHHVSLSAMMLVMRGLIASEECRFDTVTKHRLKLSQASAARTRYLADVVYPALLSRLSDGEAAAVRSLRHDAAADRAASSLHVAKWSGTRLALDWTGFRDDSAVILAMMERRIARERAVLYRLLDDGPAAGTVPLNQRAA